MRSMFHPSLVLWIVTAAATPLRSADAIIPAQRLNGFYLLPLFIDNPRNPVTRERIRLGRTLYYDARLSANQRYPATRATI